MKSAVTASGCCKALKSFRSRQKAAGVGREKRPGEPIGSEWREAGRSLWETLDCPVGSAWDATDRLSEAHFSRNSAMNSQSAGGEARELVMGNVSSPEGARQEDE